MLEVILLIWIFQFIVFLGSVLLNMGLGMVLALHASMVKLTYKWGEKLIICAQWLENYVPKPHSCLVHPSPRCAQPYAPWHTNANQLLHFVSAVLPFLIQALLSFGCWQTGESSQSTWSAKLVCTWTYWLPVLQYMKCTLWNKYFLLIKTCPTIQDPVNKHFLNVFNITPVEYSLKQLYSPA